MGERIRKLRKQKKLTLEGLAGDQLTKGMLSLIENGKANPSMESLNYIAQQLGVDTNELLEEVSSSEIREMLEEVEKIYSRMNMDATTDVLSQITSYIQPVADKLSLSYESARLLELYSRSLFFLKNDHWKMYYEKAVMMYEELNMENQRAKITTMLAMTKFTAHDYEGALRIIQEERRRIKERNVILDPVTRLDLDYYESILCFAVGQNERAITVMNEAISFSKEKSIFYLTSDLYRLAAFQAIMSGNEEEWHYYAKKLNQYADFADDKISKALIALIEAHYYTSYVQDYEKASEILRNVYENYLEEDQEIHFFDTEKGKTLFRLGRTEEALTIFENFSMPEWVHHPYDLSMLYEAEAYKALCYKKLGREKEAVESATKAMELIEPLTDTPYKEFIKKTYEEIVGN